MADTVMPEPVDARVEALRKERDRRAVKTSATWIATQAMEHAIRLVAIPLSLSLLGVEQYGLWLVVGSLIAWGGLTDLGLAPGLINVVASAQGRGDGEGMRQAISTAFAAYGALAVAVGLTAVGLVGWDALPGILGANDGRMAAKARMLVLVCGLAFAGTTITRVVGTTAQALQEGYLVSYAQLASSLTTLLLIAVLAQSGGSLLQFALAATVPQLLSQTLLGIYLFGWRHPDLMPQRCAIGTAALGQLWRYAGPLTTFQLANMMALYSANLLVANRLGPAAVPQYSVPYAASAILITAASNIVTPYMPAVAEAHAKKDLHWLREKAKGMLVVSTGLALAGGTLLTIAGPWLLSHWTGGSIRPSHGLMAWFAFFAVARSAGIAVSSVSHGLDLVKSSAWTSMAASSFYVISAWFSVGWLGIAAIPLSAGAASLGYSIANVPGIRTKLRNCR